MAKEPKKTIFFTAGMVPTNDEYKAAEKIGRGVVFRNARRVVPGAPLENCDAVAGMVPEDYKAAFGKDQSDLGRPNATRLPSSNGPDDYRPGTVDTGIAHESGTGSTPLVARQPQELGRDVWEKQPKPTAEQWPGPAETGKAETEKEKQPSK